MMNDWISIELKKPPENMQVLLYDINTGICIGNRIQDKCYTRGFTQGLHNVTHWMPLPPQPM